jgi:hypothetical protein
MIPSLDRNSGEDPVIGLDDRAMFNGREQALPINEALRILEELGINVEKEAQKATTQITKSYQQSVSQRIPEVVWGSQGKSIIDVARGLLGRKDQTDLARQRAAKTIDDLPKLLAYLQANLSRYGDYGHQVLMTTRIRMANRNAALPDELRDYGAVIDRICSSRMLSMYEDSLEMIDTIGKAEITRAIPQRKSRQ